ncbi:PHB depolymerase family esterase [Galbitalea sp. SE-J8]|uniref:alpha/beta hydrolase family esterase n=1 Tax=Galbitalea sp. SE-J8 TaxID=3054952 RepID=UPI00259CC2EF|nr:PHB depolymerase family esterase [Galbitalea sp. SE-J8]MDM4762537.1 PHB depolymerase family esterase [Galbitalea sp. SE-J8]
MRNPGARLLGALAALVVVAASVTACSTPAPAPAATAPAVSEVDSGATTIDVGGAARSVIIRDTTSSAIAQATNARVPALIVLHGASGSNTRTERSSGLTPLAERDGFVVAYPRGTSFGRAVGGYAWNAQGCCGRPVTRDVPDVAFLSAIIDTLIAEHNVDPDRVYLAGFSNGGMMTYRFACELGGRLAGIMVVSGALNVSSCAAPKALPVLIVHGTADRTVPYDGGPPGSAQRKRLGTWTNASVARAAAFWASRDGCGGADRSSHGRIRTAIYAGCDAGSGLEVVSIRGGGHTWPTTAVSGYDAARAAVSYFGLDQPTDPFAPADPTQQQPPVEQATPAPTSAP